MPELHLKDKVKSLGDLFQTAGMFVPRPANEHFAKAHSIHRPEPLVPSGYVYLGGLSLTRIENDKRSHLLTKFAYVKVKLADAKDFTGFELVARHDETCLIIGKRREDNGFQFEYWLAIVPLEPAKEWLAKHGVLEDGQ